MSRIPHFVGSNVKSRLDCARLLVSRNREVTQSKGRKRHMGSTDWIKKEIEYELLDAFAESSALITGRVFSEFKPGESPDFTAVWEG